MTVEIRYGVVFGKCDASDWIDWEVELTEEEEAAYNHAIKMRIPLNEVSELEEALSRAYSEIEEQEIENGIDFGDEYVLECTGKYAVDPDEINELVQNRDGHALRFFKLEELSDEELNEWDANDLEELPDVCDFDEGFKASSPYDGGWCLNVEFCDPNEEKDVTEEEATIALQELFTSAKGDYTQVKAYIERIQYDYFCDCDPEEIALQIASELGLSDYVSAQNEE